MNAYMGVDIGSSSSKVAILRREDKLLALAVVNLGAGTGAVEEARTAALKQAALTEEDIDFTVVTGYGRMTYRKAQLQVTEITCHARGAYYLCPEAGTIVDIGGQDAKVIFLDEQGRVANFAMNEKCAAGTGRFLEVMSRVLGCPLGELSDLDAQAAREISISSTCTVFAESEAISKLAAGVSRPDVAHGAHRSIAKRVAGMCARGSLRDKVVMTGGVALNKDAVRCLGQELKREIIPLPNAQGVGALGAALIARDKSIKSEVFDRTHTP